MKINCIVVDDEPLARKGLTEYVGEVGFLNLIGACESSIAANKIINEQEIDLMFLDIHMPKMTGLEFVKTLRKPTMIIFTTAYSEYALQGFELDVLDYLVKPISFERFLKAVNKAKEFYDLRSSIGNNTTNYFFIHCEGQYEKIFLDDLLFVEAMENYVVLQTTLKRFIAYLTFKGIEKHLPRSAFIKVHRSFIVSISKVDKIIGNEIKIDKFSISMSRSMKDEVMEKLVNAKLLKR